MADELKSAGDAKPLVDVFAAAAAAKKAAMEKAKQAEAVEETDPEWEGWKDIFLIGTEWTNFDGVYKRDWEWNFDHLDKDLHEAGGALTNPDKNYYIFGTTEPQILDTGVLPMPVVPIPVFVAIEADKKLAPIEKLGIKSVQMNEERIVPMRSQRMSWGAFDVGDKKRSVFVLKCTQRRANLKNMTEEAQKSYEYCMPYIFLPHMHAQPAEYSSAVQICRNVAGKQLVFEFDWRMDDVEDFSKELAASEEMKEGGEEELQGVIKEEVAKAKEAIKAERAAMKAKIDAIPDDEKAMLKDMKFSKYYPQNRKPDVSGVKSQYINRYFGRAHVLK